MNLAAVIVASAAASVLTVQSAYAQLVSQGSDYTQSSDYKLQIPGATGARFNGGKPAGAGFPQRRAGLWQVTTAGSQAAGLPPAQYCIDDTADNAQNHLDRVSGDRGSCSIGEFRAQGAAWVAESSCKDGKISVLSRSVVTGEFDQEYRIDTVVSYDPPLRGGRTEDKTATLASYIGPCKPGQKPGDVFIAGMGGLNMVDGSVHPIQTETHAATRKRRDATSPGQSK